ncbi:MAG: peptidyl-prolyl cis-trans isomerase [Gammaproteobacteria bacterium]|nr:peptidyl-prolyl cis-trans isomerase [Gammaproteobacteria bacterium]
MLQHIREKFTGVFAIILLGVLAMSFVFFGIGNFNFLNAGNAATVEGVEISIFQLENAYQNELLQRDDYSSLSPEMLRAIRANTLELLIRDTALEVHVAGKGYRVGDEQIARAIQSEPQFQNEGVFNKELYYAWLDQMVIDARMFEERQRGAYRRSQLQRGIGATSFVTPAEYRRYLNLIAEQRIASIATFDIAALADTIVVRDEDVQAYYDARPDDFRAPESVDFEYLEVRRDQLAGEIEVAADVLQQYYEDNSSRFLQDEQRRARHILLLFGDDEAAAEEQARALTARVQAGEPFEDLARQYSADGGSAQQGGDLGSMMQSQMPGALGDAIFSMDSNEILGPVRSEFGFHVVKLDAIIPGGPLPLDQVRGELLAELRVQGVEERFRNLERQLADAVFDADDLQTIAEATGLEVRSVTEYTRNGGGPFGANQAVIEAVYDPLVLTDRQISDLIEIDADRSIMVRVTDYHEEARRPLEEVKDDIVFALQSERAVNIIDDRSRRLREALEEGEDFEETAFQLEASFQPDVTITRFQQDIDAAVMDAIFRAKKPTAGNARLGSTITTTGDYVVFMVKAVVPGAPEMIPLAERDQRKASLESAAGAQDLNAYMNELIRTADIERSDDALSPPEFLQ